MNNFKNYKTNIIRERLEIMLFNFKDFDLSFPLYYHYILENNIILISIKIYYLK